MTVLPMKRSPQLEDGYTRLANELLDAFLSAGISGRQWPILMAIVRKTYGFNKKEDDIGLSQLAEMTGIAKPHVSVVVRELVDRNIIVRKVGRYGHILAVNKNFAMWTDAPEKRSNPAPVKPMATVTELVTVTDSVTGGYGIGNAGVTESVTGGVTESVTTKDNPPKDNQKTTSKRDCALPAMLAKFERFYLAYPKKKSRGQAFKTFVKLNPDEQLMAAILAGVEKAKKSEQWRDVRYIPYPSSWLNDQGWLDEVQVEYTDAEQAVIQAYNEALGERLGEISLTPFSELRAAAIRDFLTFSEKPDFWKRFFPWVRDNTDLPPKVGFDWLVTREGFTKVRGGQHNKK